MGKLSCPHQTWFTAYASHLWRKLLSRSWAPGPSSSSHSSSTVLILRSPCGRSWAEVFLYLCWDLLMEGGRKTLKTLYPTAYQYPALFYSWTSPSLPHCKVHEAAGASYSGLPQQWDDPASVPVHLTLCRCAAAWGKWNRGNSVFSRFSLFLILSQ